MIRYFPMLVGGAALVLTGVVGLAGNAFAQTTLCSAVNGPFAAAAVAGGEYRVMTDEWQSSSPLCVDAGSGPAFSVSESVLGQSVVGAYPNISANAPADGLPIAVGDLRSAVSDWRTNLVSGGAYDVAYDLTYSTSPLSCTFAGGGEVMVWLDRVGHPYPKGPLLASGVAVDGTTWNVHGDRSQGGSGHNLLTFVRAAGTPAAANLDLAAFTRSAVRYGYLSDGLYLCRVQAGFEIWRGGQGLATTYFSLRTATSAQPPTFPNSSPSAAPTDSPAGQSPGAVMAGLSGLCLDDYHSGTNDGNKIIVHPCNKTAAQGWSAGQGGTLSAMGKCLTIASTPTPGGTPVVLSGCVPGAWRQAWQPGPSGSLVNPHTGACLTASAVDVQVMLTPCDARQGQGQAWRLAGLNLPA